jgi:hypothetical protein
MVCACSRVSRHQHSGEACRMSSFEACLGHFEDLNDHVPVRLESRGSLCCFGPGSKSGKNSPLPAGACQMSALTSSRFLVCLNYVNVIVATGRGIRSKTREEVCSSVGPRSEGRGRIFRLRPGARSRVVYPRWHWIMVQVQSKVPGEWFGVWGVGVRTQNTKWHVERREGE